MSILNKIIGWAAAILLALVLALVTIQIIFRYVLSSPLSWTQELSVYSTIVMVMLGTALAVFKAEHISVVFIVELFPPRVRGPIVYVANIIVFCFFAMLTYQSWGLAMRSMRQISPTTGIPTGMIILCVTIGSFLSCAYLIIRMICPYVHIMSDEVKGEIGVEDSNNEGSDSC